MKKAHGAAHYWALPTACSIALIHQGALAHQFGAIARAVKRAHASGTTIGAMGVSIHRQIAAIRGIYERLAVLDAGDNEERVTSAATLTANCIRGDADPRLPSRALVRCGASGGPSSHDSGAGGGHSACMPAQGPATALAVFGTQNQRP